MVLKIITTLLLSGQRNFTSLMIKVKHFDFTVCYYCYHNAVFLTLSPAAEEKAEPPQAMNALMRLNQLKPGLQYKLISQTGPVHVPVFTMAVEVDGKTFEASGPSKRTAKLHVAVKVGKTFARLSEMHIRFHCCLSVFL